MYIFIIITELFKLQEVISSILLIVKLEIVNVHILFFIFIISLIVLLPLCSI